MRPYGRGTKQVKRPRPRADWLKCGGTVVRKGFVVSVQVTRDNVVLRACSVFVWRDVRQFHVPRAVWEGVSDDQREGWLEMALRKPGKDQAAGPRPAQQTVELFGECPTLRSYLLDRKFEDGTPRVTGTFTVFLNDQGWLGCILKDRDGDRALFGVGATLEELGSAIEEQLIADETPWRADRLATGNSKRIR